MSRLGGQVAFVTGAARGQGRAHAVAMAREGADVIAVDICRQLESVPYELASPEDLAETARLVRELGRRIVAVEADCRDGSAIRAAVDKGAERLGGIDIGVINHGIFIPGSWEDQSNEDFDLVIDVNLNAVWRAARATIPHLVDKGGSLILTASSAALRAAPGIPAYVASKFGVVGLAQSLAVELGPRDIRVNAICPGNVLTPMLDGQHMYDVFNGGPGGTRENLESVLRGMNLMPVPWVSTEVIADVAVFLASHEGRHITGTAFPIDDGNAAVPPGVPPLVAEEIGRLRALLQAAGISY